MNPYLTLLKMLDSVPPSPKVSEARDLLNFFNELYLLLDHEDLELRKYAALLILLLSPVLKEKVEAVL
jgi:hypothetical protein